VKVFEDSGGLVGLETLEYANNEPLRQQADNILDTYFYKDDGNDAVQSAVHEFTWKRDRSFQNSSHNYYDCAAVVKLNFKFSIHLEEIIIHCRNLHAIITHFYSVLLFF